MNRVLIVDDKQESLYFLRTLLEANRWEVVEASHGAEALIKAHQAPPTLIVSDLLMPVMDGYTLLRQWKVDERLKRIPFVVYTATYTDPQDERLALDLGADAFILKPAEPETFMARVEDVLAKAGRGELAASGEPRVAGQPLVTKYSQVLVRKLEEKALQLQEANRALNEDLRRRQQAEAEAAQAHAALVRSIEEQQRIGAELRQEQVLFQSLAGAIPDDIFFKDRQSRFVRINEHMARQLGLTAPREAVGRTDFDFFPAEQAREAFEQEQRVVSTGEPLVGIEEKRTWPDGRTTWVSTTKVPLRNPANEITGTVGISRDITERRLASERIREQAMLLDIATDGIMVLDPRQHIVFWNKGCERIYGWDSGEALGRLSSELLLPDGAVFTAACADVLRDGQWMGELCQLTKDREKITVFSRWSLLRDAHGQPKSILVINTDVTERKQLEAQLIRAQRLESIGQLASGIAHDLNNILAPLVMITPLLKEETVNPSTLRLIDMIEANTKRGTDVVKQVLTFSRGLKTGKGPVPLRPLLKEVGTMLVETLPKSIKVQVSVPDNLWIVESDPTQVHQVLMNLCVNARDAMPDGGVLTLEAEDVNVDEAFATLVPGAKAGSYVSLLVADTGMGIPPENMDRIFDPFFTTKEPGKGTGLGLSTVLGIVRDHCGFMRIESKPGKGTRFRVYLPAKPDAAAVPSANVGDGEAPRGRGETILLVDDEESVRVTARNILERYGYRVLLASEGSEAVMVFAQHSKEIHAVLTDLVMPLMDGASLIRALRKASPMLKIIAITGATDTGQATAARRLGLQALLQKPFSAPVLLQAVRAVLDGQVLTATVDSSAPFEHAKGPV